MRVGMESGKMRGGKWDMMMESEVGREMRVVLEARRGDMNEMAVAEVGDGEGERKKFRKVNRHSKQKPDSYHVRDSCNAYSLGLMSKAIEVDMYI
jgi:hypothetical protein